jgi:hypothetical protein
MGSPARPSIDLCWKPDYVPTVAEKLAEFYTKNLI